eukprot:3722755-Ditylum_brightwellii.AAC.1
MDKPDDKEDNQVPLVNVAADDVSNDSKDNEGFISILWGDGRLPTFKVRPLDHCGYKETL